MDNEQDSQKRHFSIGSRRISIERDYAWEPEYHVKYRTWMRTKRVFLKTWTAYELVGSPACSLPVFHGKNEKEVRDWIEGQSNQ